jgi:hypothetical protein
LLTRQTMDLTRAERKSFHTIPTLSWMKLSAGWPSQGWLFINLFK